MSLQEVVKHLTDTEKDKSNHINKSTMADIFCVRKLDELSQLVRLQEGFMLSLCILNLVFSLVAVLGNLLVIHALCKSSSIPTTEKKLFLNLAFSDFTVGILPQLMLGVIVAVMLKMTFTGDDNFASFCPTVVNVFYFFFFLLCCVSFLSITAIAVDRLLATLLHLRYQELVTLKRVIIALVSLWLTSVVAVFIFILLPTRNRIVVVIIEVIGLLLTTMAYARIYKVVRYHQNQIQSQLQLQNGTTSKKEVRFKCFDYLFSFSSLLSSTLFLCNIFPN